MRSNDETCAFVQRDRGTSDNGCRCICGDEPGDVLPPRTTSPDPPSSEIDARERRNLHGTADDGTSP